MKRIQCSKWFKRLKTAKKRLELFETAMKRLKRLKDSVKWP